MRNRLSSEEKHLETDARGVAVLAADVASAAVARSLCNWLIVGAYSSLSMAAWRLFMVLYAAFRRSWLYMK